jgi:serine protease Do
MPAFTHCNRFFAITLALALAIVVAVPASAMANQLPDFSAIVEKNSPAVVKIIVEQDPASSAGGHPDAEQIPEYLRRFFEYRGMPPQQNPRMGMGSGFIISADGYIITNNHVVEGADSVLVRLNDRQEFDAEIIGTDPRSDLALLRVQADNLPRLELSPDDELKVGEWVLAIGSPFGLDYSVAAGIVSAKGRSLPTENNENYVPFIQTDVAINPGNSGGPLFNLDGEVVGVNSQIFTRGGGSIGLSFAIPASVVRNVVDQLRRDGKVTRGWLGVSIQDVDKNLAESFGLDRPRGALVAQVSADSPAEKAGIETGDVIVTFDGKDITTSSDLPHVVGLIAPDTKVNVEIVRNRKPKTLKVVVGGLDADDSYTLAARDKDASRGGRIGVVVETLDGERLEQFGINGGVVVREVLPGSIAAEAGIRVGDVITLVGDSTTRSAEAFEKVVRKLPESSSVPVRLIRRGTPLFIGLRLP